MFYDDDDMMQTPNYTLEDALGALPLPANSLVPPAVIFGFSDLLPTDLAKIEPVWRGLDQAQRTLIMERLADTTEADFALDFSMIAYLGYDDSVEAVRLAAIRAGWADESPRTLEKLMYMVQTDRSQAVRAAAMSQIGQYLYLGEIGELSKDDTTAAEELAYSVLVDNGEDQIVRSRALEAIAHTSRTGVDQLIEDAYHSGNSQFRLSAVTAMGNSCDDRWTNYVMAEMDSTYIEMVMEAVSAAGNIGIDLAIPKLLELAYSDEEALQETAIWALGEIGGDEAIEALQQLVEFAEAEGNDDLLDTVEEALASAEMMGNFGFGLEDFGDDYDEE